MMPPVGRIHRLIATAALATGCAHLVSAPTPMRAKYDRVDPAKRARCLLIMLPGIGDDDTDFADRGFLTDLRERNLSVDTISANATLGYYARRTVGERLEAEVLVPNRGGYEQVWVLGLSMGGLGSIVLAERLCAHANRVRERRRALRARHRTVPRTRSRGGVRISSHARRRSSRSTPDDRHDLTNG